MKLEEEIKQKKFRNMKQKTIVNLLFTGSWVQSEVSQRLKPYGLSSQQFNILRILRGQHPNPVRANNLKERMLDKMSNISRLIEKLRLKELLDRKICPNDRRAVDVTITPKGLAVLAELDKSETDWENGFGSLENEELEKLNYLLDKLRG